VALLTARRCEAAAQHEQSRCDSSVLHYSTLLLSDAAREGTLRSLRQPARIRRLRYDAGVPADKPLVGVIMGSKSDWETLRHADAVLTDFNVPHECRVVSAHRTPVEMADYARGAAGRGLKVIIAGAGGAAHLPGMVAAHTSLPVIGVPVESHALKGLDSLLSIVQMPGGVPVATVAIGKAGATNAGLLAVSILATSDPALRERLEKFRADQTARVKQDTLE
jgi:5-(carboxyamino)imidazole ribonucleotide mutase